MHLYSIHGFGRMIADTLRTDAYAALAIASCTTRTGAPRIPSRPKVRPATAR